MASISGGAVITYSSTSSFTVDASGSYDLDYPSSSILSFGWTCVTISPSFGAKCLPYFSDKSYSTLNITQGNLGVGQYVVSVYVTNKLGRQASSNVTLIILKGQIPQVWIAPPQAKYNPTDKIILTGTVGATVGTAWAAWNVSCILLFILLRCRAVLSCDDAAFDSGFHRSDNISACSSSECVCRRVDIYVFAGSHLLAHVHRDRGWLATPKWPSP